jgi:DNA-directed RNA polymerase subunit RPC12/RpoP
MQSNKRLNPISINEGFKCLNCGKINPKAPKTCRNHCKYCLYSLHVDLETPGDRASNCHGLLQPVSLDKTGKKGFIIFHKCLKCGKISKNKVADDDSMEAVIAISTTQTNHAAKQAQKSKRKSPGSPG